MLNKNVNSRIDELKIDKDCFVNKKWMSYYIKLIVRECKKQGLIVESIRKCNSKRKGFHLYIKIHPAIESKTANFLQWLFGDDALRVNFNNARIESGLLEWNKLFEVPHRRLKTIYKNNEVTHSGRSG